MICGQDFGEGTRFSVAGVVTFGQPMIAKSDLGNHFDTLLRGHYQRFVNGSDIVTRVPPGYRHCDSSVWFRNGEVIRSRPGVATYSRDGSDTAVPIATEPPPLNEREFRQLQEELRRAQNVDEEDPRRVRLYGGMLPFVRDHGSGAGPF